MNQQKPVHFSEHNPTYLAEKNRFHQIIMVLIFSLFYFVPALKLFIFFQ